MSAETVLDELRRKRRCLERAIRELERLQRSAGAEAPPAEIADGLPAATSNLLVMPRQP